MSCIACCDFLFWPCPGWSYGSLVEYEATMLTADAAELRGGVVRSIFEGAGCLHCPSCWVSGLNLG